MGNSLCPESTPHTFQLHPKSRSPPDLSHPLSTGLPKSSSTHKGLEACRVLHFAGLNAQAWGCRHQGAWSGYNHTSIQGYLGMCRWTLLPLSALLSLDQQTLHGHPREDLPSPGCGQTHSFQRGSTVVFSCHLERGKGIRASSPPHPTLPSSGIECRYFASSLHSGQGLEVEGVPWVARLRCPSQALRGQGVEPAAQPCSWGRKREWGAGRPQPVEAGAGARLWGEREGGASI